MSGGTNAGDERVGSTICGKQSMHVAIKASGAEGEVSAPDQVEEVAVKENLLQSAPRIFMEVVKKKGTVMKR